MKRLIVLFFIFFSAVAVSPFLIGEKGYILISMGDLTIESTVVTASIFLFIVFITLLLSLKLLLGGVHFSKNTWRKISSVNQRKAEKHFKQGVSSYLLEDYASAEKQLIKSIDHASEPSTAYLLAASSAYQQTSENKSANVEYYLQCLAKLKNETLNIDHLLVTIKLHIACANYTDANELLTEYHKLIGHDARLLSLAIELALKQQHFQQVIDYLPQAYKTKVFNSTRLYDIEFDAYTGYFSKIIEEKGQGELLDAWNMLSRKEKHKQVIMLSYATVLSQHKLNESLETLLLLIININAEQVLVDKLCNLPINNSLKLMKTVQKYVQKQPDDSVWLRYFAFLAYHHEQFDVAIKAYAQLFSNAQYQNEEDAKRYAQALIQINDHQRASQVITNTLLA